MLITTKYQFSNGDRLYKPAPLKPIEKTKQEKEKGKITAEKIKTNYSTREWSV